METGNFLILVFKPFLCSPQVNVCFTFWFDIRAAGDTNSVWSVELDIVDANVVIVVFAGSCGARHASLSGATHVFCAGVAVWSEDHCRVPPSDVGHVD